MGWLGDAVKNLDPRKHTDPFAHGRRTVKDLTGKRSGDGIARQFDPGGFLPDNIKRVIGDVAAPHTLFDQDTKKPRSGPSKDLESLRKELSKDAKNFRKNLGGYTGEQYKGLLSDYREALQKGTENVNSDFSRRGLLYSGLRSDKEGDLKSQLGGQLATSAVGISREAEQLARAKEQAAASISIDMAMQNQARAEQLYDIQMQNQLARRQAMGQIASGVGYGVGAYYGAQGPQQQASYSGGGQPSYYWSGQNRVMNMPNSPSSTGTYSGSSGVGYSSPTVWGKAGSYPGSKGAGMERSPKLYGQMMDIRKEKRKANGLL